MKQKFCLIILIFFSLQSCTSKKEAEIFKSYIDDPLASRLSDFSYAGYHFGEDEIPTRQEKVVDVTKHHITPNTSTDYTSIVQELIDSIGKSGGGIIYFPAGKYNFNMDSSIVQFLKIDYSNIIIRGDGSGPNGTILFNGSNTLQEHESPWISPFLIRTAYNLQGTKKMWGLNSKTAQKIRMQSNSKADPGLDGTVYDAPVYAEIINDVKKGGNIIELDRAMDLKAGEIILIGMYNNSEEGELLKELLFPLDTFEHYMSSAHIAGPTQTASYQFTSEIAEVLAPNKIKLVQALRKALLQKYTPVIARAPMITEIGIEDLRFESAWDGYYCHHGCENSPPREAKLMDYGWNGVNFARVAHGWMRNVCFKNFTNPVYMQDSRNITLTDITIEGHNGHSGIKLYCHSNDNLIQNIHFTNHFTHLLSGEGNCYGNVFKDIISEYSGEESNNFDFHGFAERVFSPVAWNLFENIKGVAQIKGAGASFNLPNAAIGNTFWNIEASGIDQHKEVIQFYKYFDSRGNQIRNDHYRNYPGTILVGYHSTSGDTLLVEGKTENRNDDWIYIETLNKGKVYPISLYEAQLKLRLNK